MRRRILVIVALYASQMMFLADSPAHQAGLQTADWVVIAAYFVVLAGTGAYFAWRAKAKGVGSANDYFTGGHTMPVWAVAFSILATAQSAATFTGVPQQAYDGNLAYLATNLGGLIAVSILATVFIPAYYRQRVTTPYQLLETRFGPGAKQAAGWAYLVGRVFASGSRVFIGAVPVAMAMFGDVEPGHMAIAIAAFMVFGIVYTLAGGITSVIWTDVVQVAVYVGAAAVGVALLASKVSVPWSEVFDAWRTAGPDGSSKLSILPSGLTPSGSFDWSSEINLPTILTGFVLITLASHGTDQDLVQRMLTCRSAAKGSWSVISGLLVGIPTVALFLVWGLLLWVYFRRPDMMGITSIQAPSNSNKLVMDFVLGELPRVASGAAGLMICGVMAAGPAGINSGLNSMASTFVADMYRPRVRARDEAHYIRVSRLAVVVFGLILGGFALLCIKWFSGSGQSIIGFVLGVMNFAYAGLLGVFIVALFTSRGSAASVIAALCTGAAVVAALRPEIWAWWTTLAGFGGDWTTFRLAWPWQLVAGTVAATLVCAIPKQPR